MVGQQQLVVEGLGVVVVDQLPLFQGHVREVPVVAVVVNQGGAPGGEQPVANPPSGEQGDSSARVVDFNLVQQVNAFKVSMAKGRTVVLLNHDHIYE